MFGIILGSLRLTLGGVVVVSGGWGGRISFPVGRRTHAGERPESTVAIELGSRLARSIVWVICRISGKMKALATVLRAPAVVSLIAADAGAAGTAEEEEGERA